MLTFSQLVDEVVQETNRFDMVGVFASYLNQAIREVHFEPSRGNAVLYEENYQEDQLTANLDTGFSWDIPDVTRFQALQAVRFDSQLDERGNPRYAKLLRPGPRLEHENYVVQRAGPSLYFKGYGGLNAKISLSWYEYPRALKYYAVADRPASYDLESGWTYADAYDDTPELMAQAEALVTNWLILRWHTVLMEALRAKVYKRLGDEVRQRTSYSLYSQLRQGLFTSEAIDTTGFN